MLAARFCCHVYDKKRPVDVFGNMLYSLWKMAPYILLRKGANMKITEQNFVTQMIQGNEKALEYVMLHYGDW